MERDTETMNLKITTMNSRRILGFCAICTAVAFVSVSADAQNVELDYGNKRLEIKPKTLVYGKS